MSLDDELRRRLQGAADLAGADVNPAALTQAAGSAVAAASLPLKLMAGLGAVGLMVGGALGVTALKPRADNAGNAIAIDLQQYSLYDCPGGAPTGVAYPGDRVYVTGRDDGGAWLEVRDPRDQGRTLWVPSVAVDPDQVINVPVRDCTDKIQLIAAETTTTITSVESTTTTTTPTPTVTTRPTTPPSTTQAPDTQPPVVGQATRNPDQIWDTSGIPYCATQSVMTVQASDNVAVTQVTGSYGAGLSGSPIAFVHGAGTTWTASFGPFSGLNPSYSQAVAISIVARDAAGNTSTAATVSVKVYGTCLI
jgi:hypothetical protein